MSWRKKLYEHLEGVESEEAKTLLANVKTGLKELDSVEADLRITKKEFVELQEKAKTFEKASEEKTGLEKEVGDLSELVKKLVTERDEEKTKAEQATKAKALGEVKTELLPSLIQSFGKLTGNLLAKELVSDGSVLMGDDGKLILNDGGVEYKGDAVIDRIKTLHKDSIIGSDGSGTKPGKGGTPATSTDGLEDKSANELFSMALA